MHPDVKAADDRRERLGIPRSRVLARAGLSSSTWARWQSFPPKPANLERFTAALDELKAEAERKLAAVS